MKSFTTIDPADPRLALIPDQPCKAKAAPIVQAGPPKRYFILRSPDQRSPNRRASIERRRMHAASGAMPPQLASGYTISEQACLRIIADEYLAHGVCDLAHNAIAARAGCCKSIAQRAARIAERDGLISVERRPRSGRKHLSNLTRIIGAAWLAWLARGNRKAGATASCRRARPDFSVGRVVKKSQPRSPGLESRAVSPAGASREVEKEA